MIKKSRVADNVKKLIKKQGRLQYSIAKEAGYSPKTFSSMLNGRKQIKDTDIVRIALALHVTANDLFGLDTFSKVDERRALHAKSMSRNKDDA